MELFRQSYYFSIKKIPRSANKFLIPKLELLISETFHYLVLSDLKILKFLDFTK
jgi:hypothetical protein